MNEQRDLEKAARCGEPSYTWRAGQERRLQMIQQAAGERLLGRVLENGCGVGMYVKHLAQQATHITGLEYDLARANEARILNRDKPNSSILNAAGENLPFPGEYFDFILSHEVLEHVNDDRQAFCEMLRVLRPGGRMIIFVPNRGYPFETHGIYWHGRYHFGNIPLVNYLPRLLRNQLVPHARVYSKKDLLKLAVNLPVKTIQHRVIFGAYDNIIARKPAFGRTLRTILQKLEDTPLRILGLSHFWVIEKI